MTKNPLMVGAKDRTKHFEHMNLGKEACTYEWGTHYRPERAEYDAVP